MNLIEWIRTDKALPPDGQVVETISEGGVQQKLRHIGEDWFFPEGDLAVSYNITFWRPLTKEN